MGSPRRSFSAASRNAVTKPRVGLIERQTGGFADCMDEGGRRFGDPLGAVVRVLGQDRLGTEGGSACALSGEGSLPFDVLHQGTDALAVLLRRKVLPAGERREDQGLPRSRTRSGRVSVALIPPYSGSVLPSPAVACVEGDLSEMRGDAPSHQESL